MGGRAGRGAASVRPDVGGWRRRVDAGIRAGAGVGRVGRAHARAAVTEGASAIAVGRAWPRAAGASVVRDALEIARRRRRAAVEARTALGVTRARARADAAGVRTVADVDAARVVARPFARTRDARARRADLGPRTTSLANARDADEARGARRAHFASALTRARVERAHAVAIVLLDRSPGDPRRMRRVHRRARDRAVTEAERVAELVRQDAARVDGVAAPVERPAVRRAVDVNVGVMEVSHRVDVEDRLCERAGDELGRPRVVVPVDAVGAVVAGERGRRASHARAPRGACDERPRAERDVELGERVRLSEIAARRDRERERDGQGRRRPRRGRFAAGPCVHARSVARLFREIDADDRSTNGEHETCNSCHSAAAARSADDPHRPNRARRIAKARGRDRLVTEVRRAVRGRDIDDDRVVCGEVGGQRERTHARSVARRGIELG